MFNRSLPYIGMTLTEAAIFALDGGVMVLWGVGGHKGTRASVRVMYGTRPGPSITVTGKDAFDAMRAVIGLMGGRRN